MSDSYDAEQPLKIVAGVIPLGPEGAILRCRVDFEINDFEMSMTLDVYDRIEHADCIQYQFALPEINHIECYTIKHVEMLRSVHIGTKLVETGFLASEDEFVVPMGEPSMIFFQEEKLQHGPDESI